MHDIARLGVCAELTDLRVVGSLRPPQIVPVLSAPAGVNFLPMEPEQARGPRGRANLGTFRPHESQLATFQATAEQTWAPGQALGEMLGYLDRVEGFTDSDLTAFGVQRRMRRLTSILRAALARSQSVGLDPQRLNGLFTALAKHDELLSVEWTVGGPSAKSARDLIRLEITYLASGN